MLHVKVYLKFLLVVIFSYSPYLLADTLESLVMPGPVIEGHKKYEKTCKKCHSVFSKEKQDGLCRDCHKKVSADIKAKKGYHGRLDKNNKCQNCILNTKGEMLTLSNLTSNYLIMIRLISDCKVNTMA